MNSFITTGLGFRFRPIDEELIRYLIKFVSSTPFESDHFRMLDLYGNKKPCDIFHDVSPDGESTDVNYLFTQLTKKSTDGKNVNRTILGGGKWKGLDRGKEVVSKKGSVIGLKKSFRFIEDGKTNDAGTHEQKIVWTMKEYCLSDRILKSLRGRNDQIRYEDYVLCRIKKKVSGRGDHDILHSNNCHDQEIGEDNKIDAVSDHEQAMLGLGYVGVDDPNHDIGYIVPTSNSEEVFRDSDQMMSGFCAACDNDKEENIGSSSHCEEITNVNIGTNINAASGEQSMVGYCTFEDEQNCHIGSSCVNEFELLEVDEQEYERAVSSVPLLEEKMSELSNILLQGNDDDYDQYYNLLRGNLLTNKDDQSSQQLPNMISSADEAPMFDQVGISSTMMMMSNQDISHHQSWLMSCQ